ncbi:MAG: hypothetical protein WAQ74_01075 [Kiritimatiellia bacterium]|jgi:hypothetical protein
MNKEAKEILDALKKANAEELKTRILKRVEQVLEDHGPDKCRLKDITIDVSDYLK